MKKFTFLSIAIVIVALSISSCKKGENDPFLSLRSRNARLTGEWKLVEMSLETVDVESGVSTTSTTTFDGTNLVATSDGSSYTLPYSETITIEKNNTYTQTTNADGDGYVSEGTWSWTGKNKDQELKNKEALIFTERKATYDGDIDTYEGRSVAPDYMVIIDKLSNKELVISVDEKYSYSDGSSYSEQGTFTYEKQ